MQTKHKRNIFCSEAPAPGGAGVPLGRLFHAGHARRLPRHFFPAWILSVIFLLQGMCHGATIPAFDTGWYKDSGVHDPVNSNYLTGTYISTGYHSFFAFNVPSLGVGDSFSGAILRIKTNIPFGTQLAGISQTNLNFNWFSGDSLSLLNGTGGIAAYTGLGTGLSLGSLGITNGQLPEYIEIYFGADSLSALTTAQSGQVIFGGSLDSATGYVFGGTSLSGSDVELIYRTDGVAFGPVLENTLPVGTPTTATFLVDGTVTTAPSNADNTVNGLIFNPNGRLQVYNTLTVTGGGFNVPGGSAGINGGNVFVPGNFSKTGAGILKAGSHFTINGMAGIQSGSLYVNGQFDANRGVFVSPGALLGGSGLVNGNVSNNGFVAPGNSPGTLTINGNFTQGNTGTFKMEVANPTLFDRLVVSGNASLAGKLQVLSFGGYKFQYGQQFAFLQAGSISGQFDSITTSDPSVTRARFLKNGGTGTVLIAPPSYTLVARSPNQTSVAKALDAFIPGVGNDRETVSTALDMLGAGQYPAVLDVISPAFHESMADITINQAFAQTQMLNQRLGSVRLGAQGFQTIGINAEPLTYDKNGTRVSDAKDLKSAIRDIENPRWSAWTMGNGIFAKVTNVNQVPDYRSESGGFLFGGDYRWSQNFATGIYGGYQGTYADYNSAGSTRINTALFGGYATFTLGGFYADAVVGGGYSNYQVRRNIQFTTIDRTALSQQDGGQLSSALNLGYDWEVSGFTFGPVAGVQYTYAGIAPFTETGAGSLDLRVSRQNANSMQSTLGGRIAYTWKVGGKIVLIPEVRMLWQHEFLNNSRDIGASLDGGAGPGFDYWTDNPARDSVFAAAGVSTRIGAAWNASFYYNVDFGRQDYLAHMISGSLGFQF